jgi:adenylate kinase
MRRDSQPGGPSIVLLFGGPGAGKGTQAKMLSAALGIPHISSGELLRKHQPQGSETVMDRGDLLPDDLVTRVVFERLGRPDAARGAILDGYPRTIEQAHLLDEWLAQHGGQIGAAVYLEVPAEALVERIVARQPFSGRGDDNASAATRRVAVFLEELPPVLDYYAARGSLHRVDGARPVEQVHQQAIQALANAGLPVR